MKAFLTVLAVFSAVCILNAAGSPLYEDADGEYLPEFYDHARERRSPDEKVNVIVEGKHVDGRNGQPDQNSARAEYNHNLWRSDNGAKLDANTYYQKNWGNGPKQDYGGGVKFSIPIGK